MIKFFDFCAGIGTGRIALESLGAICVGFSEIAPKPEKTYIENNEKICVKKI